MKQLWKFGLGFLVLGIALLCSVYALTGGDLSKVSKDTLIPKRVTFEADEVSVLELDLSTDEVEIIGTDDDKITVDYTENSKRRYKISTSQGTLKISGVTQFHFGVDISYLLELFNGQETGMTIKVPEDLLEELEASVNTGELSINNVTVKGNVDLAATTGSVSAKDMIVEGELKAKANTGSINLERIEAKVTEIRTTTGNISLKNASLGSLVSSVNTGNMNFDQLDVKHSLDLDSDTGDIRGSLIGQMADYNITSQTSTGNNNLPNGTSGGSRNLDVSADTGDIEISFAD